MAGDPTVLAAEAFIYGFPLVFGLQQVDRFVSSGLSSIPPTPLNRFGHGTGLAGPRDTFVSVNNDTIYSIANVDTSGGPVRLDVPNASGRYYVMQFVDAWTNNFAYVGHRATGTHAGTFWLVPPDWESEPPDDHPMILFPTDVATIVGRWAVNGEDDLPAACELQAALRLTPTEEGAGLPSPDPSVPEELAFFEQLRVCMQAFPPPARDREYQQRFEPLGLLEHDSPYADPDQQLVEALTQGVVAGKDQLERALSSGGGPKQNGWDLTYHAFDYNLDFFEVGALDDERWKLPDGPSRYRQRAAAARAGLWGNHGYEAAYAMAYVDADGARLDGTKSYELRFPTPPPVRAFWSVTMYDTNEFFLVENPIDRYSIGDRTPGLHSGTDGSLTVVLQTNEPAEPERRANWLPTPAAPFRPILRMYEPDDAIFNGGYELPPITLSG